jgi:hypothetical protein
MCGLDSRARNQNWELKQWAPRISLEPGNKNILRKSHVVPKKILLPLHFKLGIMKQFVRSLQKTGNSFKNLCKTFPHLSDAKLTYGVFIGRDIRKLMFDEDFLFTMIEIEREAWIAFKSVVTKFLGEQKET